MKQYKSIIDMKIGETGIIRNMDAIAKNVYNRFLDLGVFPNTKVKLLNKISFNQLYIIEIDDVEICIRQKDAKCILIEY